MTGFWIAAFGFNLQIAPAIALLYIDGFLTLIFLFGCRRSFFNGLGGFCVELVVAKLILVKWWEVGEWGRWGGGGVGEWGRWGKKVREMGCKFDSQSFL